MMLKSCTPDVVCLQETKIRDVYANFDFNGYQQYWNESTDFAHLGTALLSKSSSLVAVTSDNFDVYYDKGNVIVAELKETYVVCVYVPYAGAMGITRDNRHCWYKCFQSLIINYSKINHVLYVVISMLYNMKKILGIRLL